MKIKTTRVKEKHSQQRTYAVFTTGLGQPTTAPPSGWPFTVNPKLAPFLKQDPLALIRTAVQLSGSPVELNLPPPLTAEQRAFMNGALLQRPFLIIEFNTVGIQVLPQVGQKVGTTPDELHSYTDRSDRLLRLDAAGRLVSQRSGDGRRLLAGMQREAGKNIDGFYVQQLATLPADSPVRAQYLLDYAQIQVFQLRTQAQAGASKTANAATHADLSQKIEATELQTLAEQSLDRLGQGQKVDQAGLEAIYKYYGQLLAAPGAPALGTAPAPAGGTQAPGTALPATGKGQTAKGTTKGKTKTTKPRKKTGTTGTGTVGKVQTPPSGTTGPTGSAGTDQRLHSRG